jgi:hypothetical protein
VKSRKAVINANRRKRKMVKERLGKTLATIGGAIKPVLATAEAAADDETGAAVRIEQTRYERQILSPKLRKGRQIPS